jgi:hypothetical protein
VTAVVQHDRGYCGDGGWVRVVNAGHRSMMMFKRLMCAVGVTGSLWLLPTPASAQMT